jgi:hypothetical protein
MNNTTPSIEELGTNSPNYINWIQSLEFGCNVTVKYLDPNKQDKICIVYNVTKRRILLNNGKQVSPKTGYSYPNQYFYLIPIDGFSEENPPEISISRRGYGHRDCTYQEVMRLQTELKGLIMISESPSELQEMKLAILRIHSRSESPLSEN